jgi:protein tyrosine/serine phosphatase
LPNCYRLSPGLYRGAQPAPEGFTELEKLGVRTVLSLRAFHRDPRDVTALAHKSISFKFWHPEDEDVARFLRIATDPKQQPVFVHCQHGADRTGMMCAIWRVAVEGWSKEDAVREMTTGPFGYHPEMKHLAEYVRSADIDALCRRAGIVRAAPRARTERP